MINEYEELVTSIVLEMFDRLVHSQKFSIKTHHNMFSGGWDSWRIMTGVAIDYQ